MDLDDCNLVLIDPIDDKILNTQPITSIRVWGVGRDNSRFEFENSFLQKINFPIKLKKKFQLHNKTILID